MSSADKGIDRTVENATVSGVGGVRSNRVRSNMVRSNFEGG